MRHSTQQPLLVFLLLYLLFQAGCRSIDGSAVALDSVQDYSSVLDALCPVMLASEGQVDIDLPVIAETRPVVEIFALRTVYAPETLEHDSPIVDEERSEHIRHSFEARPITFNLTDNPCRFVLVRSIEALDTGDFYLEISDVVINPFSEYSSLPGGVFARLQEKGQFSGSWYWVETSLLPEQEPPGKALRLPIEDG